MEVYSNTELDSEILDWPVYMQRALDLARSVVSAAPNPRVGCVIVKDKTVIAEGWHSAAGQAHAEAKALSLAAEKARGGIAFVTLEPCCHTGRTGPCVDALIAAGVEQVVIAIEDPNPAVAGQGIARLEAAGIVVTHLHDFEVAARHINNGYFKRRTKGVPWVKCKLAMSLDGRTALANGKSKWITGIESRVDVQLLRASSCAVLTGIGTVLADDPALNVRTTELPLLEAEMETNALALARQPLRVILDTELRTPGTARILGNDGLAKIYTTVAPAAEQFPAEHVDIRVMPGNPRRVDLYSVLESLASDFQCNEILVEAGSTLSAAFLNAGLVDELIVYIGPKLLGSDGRSLLEISGLTSLSESSEFDIIDLKKIGGDVRLTLIPRKR